MGTFPKLAGMPCPSGTKYFADTTVEFDVPAGGWYYFHTSALKRKVPVSFDIRSNSTVVLYIQYRSQCPDGKEQPNATISASQKVRIPVPVPEDVHVVTNGFNAVEPAHVKVKLLGQRPKKPMSPVVRSIILFVVMAVITIVYFVNCVLPPLKTKVE
jgi:hypothetical protein